MADSHQTASCSRAEGVRNYLAAEREKLLEAYRQAPYSDKDAIRGKLLVVERQLDDAEADVAAILKQQALHAWFVRLEPNYPPPTRKQAVLQWFTRTCDGAVKAIQIQSPKRQEAHR